MAARIEQKIREALKPAHFELINESHQHSSGKGAESHFRLVCVSDAFNDASRIQRSRMVHELLQQELKDGVHALSLKLFTPNEWQSRGAYAGPGSPPCHGGGQPKR